MSSNRLCKWHEDMQELLQKCEHLPANENPVADTLSRGVAVTKKVFTNEPVLSNFEKPPVKTMAAASPVILELGKETRQCTTPDCEALARNNSHQLCQVSWATVYEKQQSELLAPGIGWSEAAKEVKQTRIVDRKRKNADQFVMRYQRMANPKLTSLRHVSYFSCTDGACPQEHSLSWDAGDRSLKHKRNQGPHRRKGRNLPPHPRLN